MKMARTKSTKTMEEKILYEEKKMLEAKELLDAIARSSKTRAEVLAFLES